MALLPIWLHVLGVITWVGGLVWQAHVLLPLARHGEVRHCAAVARRARPVTWAAVAIVALTGFYNVTRLGSLERVMQTGAGLALAGKFMLVLAMVALAAQRDFAHAIEVRAGTGIQIEVQKIGAIVVLAARIPRVEIDATGVGRIE